MREPQALGKPSKYFQLPVLSSEAPLGIYRIRQLSNPGQALAGLSECGITYLSTRHVGQSAEDEEDFTTQPYNL